MTEVRNSKGHDLEERTVRFAQQLIEFAGILPLYGRKGKIGFWFFGFGYCLGFRASDLGFNPCLGYAQPFKMLHIGD